MQGFPFKPDDQPAADHDAPVSAPSRVVVPKAARSQLIAIAARLTEQHDVLEALFAYVTDPRGRQLLKRAYTANEATIHLALAAVNVVERG